VHLSPNLDPVVHLHLSPNLDPVVPVTAAKPDSKNGGIVGHERSEVMKTKTKVKAKAKAIPRSRTAVKFVYVRNWGYLVREMIDNDILVRTGVLSVDWGPNADCFPEWCANLRRNLDSACSCKASQDLTTERG
jgi:hypothetical protein